MPSKNKKNVKGTTAKQKPGFKPLTKKEEDELLKAFAKAKGSCPCGG